MQTCDESDIKNGKLFERNTGKDVTVQIIGTCGKSLTVNMASDRRTNDDVLKEEMEMYTKSGRSFDMIYGIEDNPPIHLCFLFGLQQVLLSISSTVSIPLIVCAKICADDLDLVKSEIMSTFLFMCGICTILQDTIGVRLV
ncbi:hypothetical protein CHS0354_020795 [Potamilus streckersoni]|uniref:Uncharacterized protein n=1 Tax=Potamilus streckersoni TaxID=2493646 RepID=A0AAE0RQW7_9BIVA|nr:hypothetical protein CHS0354_020795 [Potamilus streckersoni]